MNLVRPDAAGAKPILDPSAQSAIEAMEEDVKRAKSYAGGVRHLRSLMNHEKY